MKTRLLHAFAVTTALLAAAPVLAQTASDADKQKTQSLAHAEAPKQPAQSLAHSEAPKQPAQSLAHNDASKQKAQSLSHSDPGSVAIKQQ